MTWDEVLNWKQLYEGFGRSVEADQFYRKHLQFMTQEWRHTADAILHREFQFPVLTCPTTQKKFVDMNNLSSPKPHKTKVRTGGSFMSEEGIEVFYSFQRNDFPYNLCEGIYQYLLWSVPRPLSYQEANTLLISGTIGLIEGTYVAYTNPPALQSIPQLAHYHVYTQRVLEFQADE